MQRVGYLGLSLLGLIAVGLFAMAEVPENGTPDDISLSRSVR